MQPDNVIARAMKNQQEPSTTMPDDQALPAISVVVPVYNSEGSLGPLVERLHAVLDRVSSAHEIILVNDGSRDGSWDVIAELASSNPRIRGIDLMRNFGQHNALLCGIRAARHGLIVTIDDDLQHPPEEIPKLLAKLGEGYDVVYGTPEHEQHGLWRDLASVITKLALRAAMGVDVAGRVSAFRVLRTRVRDAFVAYDGPFVSIDVLLTCARAPGSRRSTRPSTRCRA
jgi:glycosyltransferase involved in cell wall biosynthesis